MLPRLSELALPWPWALPFGGLLLSIAVSPLVEPKFWQAHYGKIAFMWSVLAVTPLAALYGQALALVQRNRPADAIPILQPLLTTNQGVIMLHTLLAQAQVAAGRIKDGLSTFERAEVLFPRNIPLTVHYAEALITANQSRKAHDVLLDLFNNVPPTPAEIRLTALAASSAGDAGDAYYYMGEYNIANGELQLATQQLELALSAPDLTVIQRKRFQARLKELRDAILEDRRANGGRAPGTGNNGGAGGQLNTKD